MRSLLCTLIFVFAVSLVKAQLVLPKVIGSGMVLQREKSVPIWGWAKPGQKVDVKFAKQKLSATADENGKWSVTLEPMKASFKPREMEISTDTNITLTNI